MATPFTENQKKVAEKLVENGVIEKAQPGFKNRDSDAFHKESEKGAENWRRTASRRTAKPESKIRDSDAHQIASGKGTRETLRATRH